MKSFNHAYTVNDELYTPPKLVRIMLPYIDGYARRVRPGMHSRAELTVWCPFSTADCEFVKILSAEGYHVLHSHISEGRSFFDYEPDSWDIAVDNPPFSRKDEVFSRLFGLGKPFAMVSNLMIINYQCVGDLFLGRHIQMLIPNKKVSFNGHTSSFCSGYICSDILPQDIIFCPMNDNNTGKNFEPSRLYVRPSDGGTDAAGK